MERIPPHLIDPSEGTPGQALVVSPDGTRSVFGDVNAGAPGDYVTTLEAHGAAGDGRSGSPTDDSAAWMSVIAAVEAAGGGTLDVGDACYLFNQALQTSRNGYTMLPLPNAPFHIRGVRKANNCDPRTSTGYSIFRTTVTGLSHDATHGTPSLLGGPTDDAHWLEQMVTIENICFWLPHNPTMSGVDLRYVRRMQWDGSVIYAINVGDTDFVQPTSIYTFGLRTPDSLNYNAVVIENGASSGTYAGLVGSSESLTILYWSSKWHVVGWSPGCGGHAVAAVKFDVEWCNYMVAGWSETVGVTSFPSSHTGDTNSIISVVDLDIEDAAGTPWYATVEHIHDPTNRLHGRIRYNRTVSGVGPTTGLTVSGASNVTLDCLMSAGSLGVPTSRQVATDTTLTGGGDLSADRTLGVDTTAELERIQDAVGAMVVAGTNVTATYNDTAGTLTLSASGGSGIGGLVPITTLDNSGNLVFLTTEDGSLLMAEVS